MGRIKVPGSLCRTPTSLAPCGQKVPTPTLQLLPASPEARGSGASPKPTPQPLPPLPLAVSLPRVCFYGFNLNKGFLISCLRSCQSEKFLYYMRLQVLELSQLHNTQHHYPAAPYHSGWRACGIRCHRPPRPRHQPAALQLPRIRRAQHGLRRLC